MISLRCAASRRRWFACVLPVLMGAATGWCAEPISFASLRIEYAGKVRPIVKRLCLDCHGAELKEGQLDLERFEQLSDVRRDPRVWQKVAEMLASGEMPPAEADQPNADERKLLRDWVRRYLDAEARAGAGDPGPVLLRRLSNAEYTYTVRDLTGAALDPAREFPADSAAGEGFTNTGAALVMSPALFAKYLEAAKQIAGHAVLLPDGIRFSTSQTRRDWASEVLHEIRALYLAHTSGDGDVSKLNRWDVANPLEATDADGRVDLGRYIAAVVRHRQRLLDDRGAAAAIAREEGLNARYLRLLGDMLATGQPKSLLLDRLRDRWRAALPDDAPAIAAEVAAWQGQLWKFNAVGHFGSIRPWQQPANPLPETATLRQTLAASGGASEISLWLTAAAVSGQAEKAAVVWRRPRIEFKDRPPILLRDIRPLATQIQAQISAELARTERSLGAAAELRSSTTTLEDHAAQKRLDAPLLRAWTNYLDLGRRVDRTIQGHLSNKMIRVEGYEAINGWGVPATPCILANSSDKPISFLTLTVPARGVTAHPSPEHEACIAWRSPLAGRVQVRGRIADADDKCGNGAAWRVELRTAGARQTLAHGVIDNGKAAEFRPEEDLGISAGDLLIVSIGPRDRNHTCDTTHVELTITEQADEKRQWDLAEDVSGDIHAGNPHADRLGNKDVWHFFAAGSDADQKIAARTVPAGSALARWREAAASASSDELASLARQVQARLAAPPDSLNDADKAMIRDLTDWNGPLGWAARGASTSPRIDSQLLEGSPLGLDPAWFGRHPGGKPLDDASLVTVGAQALQVRLPAELVRGGEFIVDGALDDDSPGDCGVQLQVSAGRLAPPAGVQPGAPIVTRGGSAARAQLERAYNDFREFFPVAMCYARIVPVDEVVTLVLYHREDEHLARLMLDERDVARLDRLWDELRFVSQEALVSVTAYEQIAEFATQDRPDLVEAFKPLQQPILERAEAFRRRLIETEPRHVEAVLQLAERAYRRPLVEREMRDLRGLYAALRGEEMPHDEAIRALLARVLASPAFLYRLEQPGPGAAAVDVSSWELASRLSYFLWSSPPDEALRAAAAAGKLTETETLKAEARRMLGDQRSRRLAVEFACQWLQVRDFDQFDEKSQRHFPSFAELRGDMYEESILFFAGMVQNDGSVLDLLDADHTFLNAKLARHYGIPNVEGDQWRKVEGVKQFARGGVLAQAAVLARQSGASRTSPILRGNWVSETLLGDRLPRPPKNVPQLPEEVPQGLSERQLIERHSSDAACAKCHARIDPYGFALEQFDAIGRLRQRDAEGHPLNLAATLPDGTRLEGLEGLRKYLLSARREDFLRQFCRKLLGYALGRSVQLSDQPLLDKMMADLAANEFRFSAAVDAIVLSPQFRQIRGRQYLGPGEQDSAESSGGLP